MPFYPIMNGCSLILIDSQVFPLGNQAFLTYVNNLNIPAQWLDDRKDGSIQSCVIAVLNICFHLADGYPFKPVAHSSNIALCENFLHSPRLLMLNRKQFIADMTVCVFYLHPNRAQDAITHTYAHTIPFLFLLSACKNLSVFVKNGATLCANLSDTKRTT